MINKPTSMLLSNGKTDSQTTYWIKYMVKKAVAYLLLNNVFKPLKVTETNYGRFPVVMYLRNSTGQNLRGYQQTSTYNRVNFNVLA